MNPQADAPAYHEETTEIKKVYPLTELNSRGKPLVKALESRGVKQSDQRAHVSDAIRNGLYAITVVHAIRDGQELEEAHNLGTLAIASVKGCRYTNSLATDLCQFVVDNGGTPKTAKQDLNDILHAAACARSAMPHEIAQQLAAIQARQAQDMIDILGGKK